MTGTFLPPVRPRYPLLPDGVLSGDRGRLWTHTHTHTHTHTGPGSSGCLIYFYVKIWLLDLVKPSVTFTTAKWWAEVSKYVKSRGLTGLRSFILITFLYEYPASPQPPDSQTTEHEGRSVQAPCFPVSRSLIQRRRAPCSPLQRGG